MLIGKQEPSKPVQEIIENKNWESKVNQSSLKVTFKCDSHGMHADEISISVIVRNYSIK